MEIQVYVDGISYYKLEDILVLDIFEDNSIHPHLIFPNGTKTWSYWGSFERLHRTNDLPAIEYANGDKEWWKFGKRHRINGPAVIYGNKQYWFLQGEFIKSEEIYV